MPKVGLIVLAAGASSRMGTPKQLLPVANSTLLERAILAASGTKCSPILVVLGANADRIRKSVRSLKHCQIICNHNWQDGLSSSIRAGIEYMSQLNPIPDGVILMTCDQPLIVDSMLNDLIDAFSVDNRPAIVASKYDGTAGVPALFDQSLFSELLKLSGDKGAKSIIYRHATEAVFIDFGDALLDIDTADDYEALLNIDGRRSGYVVRQVSL